MKEIIKDDLMLLAHKILSQSFENADFVELKQEAKALYERIVIAEYLQKNQHSVVSTPVQSSTNEVKGFAQFKGATINDSFQKKQEPTLDEILSQVPKDLVFEEKNQLKENVVKTLNDVVGAQNIQFGLNDRIAFISHLFEGNEADFTEAVTALSKLQSAPEAIRFIQERIKPVFNNWVGKEEYEERFVNIVMRRFN